MQTGAVQTGADPAPSGKSFGVIDVGGVVSQQGDVDVLDTGHEGHAAQQVDGEGQRFAFVHVEPQEHVLTFAQVAVDPPAFPHNVLVEQVVVGDRHVCFVYEDDLKLVWILYNLKHIEEALISGAIINGNSSFVTSKCTGVISCCISIINPRRLTI